MDRPDRTPTSGFHCTLGVLLCILLIPSELSAQYFGRNKVQYDAFAFRVIETEHFDIHYYPEQNISIMDVARMAERWHERFSDLFQHQFADRKPIIFYADDADFQQTNVIAGFIGQGVGGVTEGLKNRIVMPMTGIYAETDHVLGHELIHVYQYDIAQRDTLPFNIQRLPLWFVEGMAEYLTLGRHDPHTAMWMRDAVRREDLPTVAQLTRDPRYFPYRFGQAFWAYVGGRWGDQVVPLMYRDAGRLGMDSAFVRHLGVTPDSLSAMWHRDTRAHFEPMLAGRTAPEEVGRRVIAPDIDGGNTNIGPAVSPDGRYVAFLSERELFGIDLFLADAETGEVIRRLVSAETDPHFDALRFINSAGAWSPDGRYFAFVVFQDGENRIAIMDMERRRVVRRMRARGVGTITAPTWSPDAQYIAFSGNFGGISNLYRINLETREVEQLTEGKYAVIHPTWSPDGETIAFVTDQGEETDFDLLTYGEMQIAFYDVNTGQVTVQEIFENTLHTNPQFGPNGEDLYFVATREGFPDIYRLRLATGEITQLTNIATGVTGITDLAPALSVARETGRIMFSVFEGGDHVIYSLDADQVEAYGVGPDVADAGVLPPVEVTRVETYLADARTGLLPPQEFEPVSYSPRLELDYIGSPGVGVATSTFGTGLAGGVSLFFSDMLGNHNLGAALQAQGTWRDIGGQLAYTNLERRLNWGVSAARIPFLSGFAGIEPIGPGEFDLVRQFFWQYYNQLMGLAQYPFSMTRRWEANAGYTRLAFDVVEERTRYIGGVPVARDREGAESPPGLNMFEASTAYVGDNSFFGFTSPVQGARYRFQGGATLGSLNFYTVLADWRRYNLQRPVTFAFRALHYARYGPDAEDRRLSPLFLGNPMFIRGYGFYSMGPGEFNNVQHLLIGSRMAVANVEVRVPLFGVDRFGLINFPFLPTELSVFADGGLAWADDRPPVLRFEETSPDQVPIFSTGVSARVNVLGALVVEFFYAYPFQRPATGAHFGWQIAPGW